MSDNTRSVKPVTLGDLRRITSTLPDDTIIVVETGEADVLEPYQRAALAVQVCAYDGVCTVNVTDIAPGVAA